MFNSKPMRRGVCYGGALLMLLALTGCTSKEQRAHFEECKQRIVSISVIPPMVYYSNVKRPLFQIDDKHGTWTIGEDSANYDLVLSEKAQANIRSAAVEIIGASRYENVECRWPSHLDVECVPNLERVRSELNGAMAGYLRAGQKERLMLSIRPDCAVVGRCTGTSHLLFVGADGWEDTAYYEHKVASSIWDAITGKDPEPKSELQIYVMLVEASTGEIILHKRSGSLEAPHSDVKEIRGTIKDLLKPVL